MYERSVGKRRGDREKSGGHREEVREALAALAPYHEADPPGLSAVYHVARGHVAMHHRRRKAAEILQHLWDEGAQHSHTDDGCESCNHANISGRG